MKNLNTNSINIVAYHYVREIKNSKYPNIKGIEFNIFKKQIKFFKKKFDIISADDFVEIIETKKIINHRKPLLLLTFDDGYKDHYNYVFPTLIAEKITGCFYPPIKIFNGDILDVNKIHYILEKFEDKKILLNEILLYLKNEFEISIKSFMNKKNRLHNFKVPEYDDYHTIIIKKILYKILPLVISKKTCNYFFKKYVNSNLKTFSKELYISSKNLKEMSDNNMHIGSHGVNHLLWSTLNEQEQEKEIVNSKRFFKKKLINLKNFSVCFPWGSYNSSSVKILKKKKVKFALTSNSGNIFFGKRYNKFTLPRYDANEFLDV